MARIHILTPYPLEPIHPRTEMICEILTGAGHTLELNAVTRNLADELASRLTFKVFNPLGTLRKLRAALDCDLLYVQDLSLLLAAPVAHALGRPVIYETLDHCVDLRLYAQPLLARAGIDKLIKPLGCAAELALARHCTDAVIVNSDSLHEYFGDVSRRLFYASPLETLGAGNRAGLPPALLYLGAFSRDKGAHDALDLRERLALPLFVFGSVPDADVRERLARDDDVSLMARMSSGELKRELAGLLDRHFLLGLSMIHAAHYSYEVQEANKDIDYLALGIPILGNRRKPTSDKIEAGCGAFTDDAAAVARLVRDASAQAQTAERCRAYYAARYARETFARGLLQAVDDALRAANYATLPPRP
jgi:glycosyltransferase involved in cell wall biosynthesis